MKSTKLEIETSLVNKEDIIHSTKLPDACWWRTCISPRSNLSARHVRVIILHVSRQWKNKNFWPYAHAHIHIYTCTQQIHTHTNVCVHARSRSVSVCFNCYRPSRVLPKTRMGYLSVLADFDDDAYTLSAITIVLENRYRLSRKSLIELSAEYKFFDILFICILLCYLRQKTLYFTSKWYQAS